MSLLMLGTVPATAGDRRPVKLPAIPCIAPSPDGQRIVECRLVEDDPSSGREYDLVVRDLDGSNSVWIQWFMRGVDILWAPTGHHVAITDWALSDQSFVSVYTREGQEALAVADLIQRRFGLAELQGNDHVYFETIRWQTASELIVKVSGHGDRNPDGFARCFNVSLVKEPKSQPCQSP
jgi:hypothetical protein